MSTDLKCYVAILNGAECDGGVNECVGCWIVMPGERNRNSGGEKEGMFAWLRDVLYNFITPRHSHFTFSFRWSEVTQNELCAFSNNLFSCIIFSTFILDDDKIGTLDAILCTSYCRTQIYLSKQMAQLRTEITMPMFSGKFNRQVQFHTYLHLKRNRWLSFILLSMLSCQFKLRVSSGWVEDVKTKSSQSWYYVHIVRTGLKLCLVYFHKKYTYILLL